MMRATFISSCPFRTYCNTPVEIFFPQVILGSFPFEHLFIFPPQTLALFLALALASLCSLSIRRKPTGVFVVIHDTKASSAQRLGLSDLPSNSTKKEQSQTALNAHI